MLAAAGTWTLLVPAFPRKPGDARDADGAWIAGLGRDACPTDGWDAGRPENDGNGVDPPEREARGSARLAGRARGSERAEATGPDVPEEEGRGLGLKAAARTVGAARATGRAVADDSDPRRVAVRGGCNVRDGIAVLVKVLDAVAGA